jgi:L-ribulokinase
MFAATAAGLYQKVEDAMTAMGQGFDVTYTPEPARAALYELRLREYNQLGQFIEHTSKNYE